LRVAGERDALQVEGLNAASQELPRLMWEGPALPLTDVPAAAYTTPRRDVVEGTD
jgi:hypothetical protein